MITKIKQLDWLILLSSAVLLIVGGYAQQLASTTESILLTGNESSLFHHHLISVCISVLLGAVFFRLTNASFLYHNSAWLLLSGLLLTLLTLVPSIGYVVNGADRWLNIASFTIYPIPLTMLVTIIFMSKLLADSVTGKDGNDKFILKIKIHKYIAETFIKKFSLIFFGICAYFFVITYLQPDSAALIVFFELMLLMSLLVKQYKCVGLLFVLMTIYIIFSLVLNEYRGYSVLGILADAWQDQYHDGYPLIKSMIAVGGGNWFGVGHQNAIMHAYLPAVKDSFIFAAVIEQIGVIGALAIITLTSIIVYRSCVIANQLMANQKLFEGILVFGLAAWISLLSLAHLSGVLGGLPFYNFIYPFLSYGGTYSLSLILAISIILKFGLEAMPVTQQGTSTKQYINPKAFWIVLMISYSFIVFRMIDLAVFNTSLDVHYQKHINLDKLTTIIQ